jgi:Fe-S-cluster containining protein
MAEWWKKEPLRFECQPDCFKCCSKPGLVYFDKEDIRNVAGQLGVSQKQFKADYLCWVDGHFAIEVADDAPCPFLTGEGCSVHSAKPKQCQSYPFWRENLNHPNTWKLVGMFCPGVDRGPMVALETIKELLKKFRL